MKKKMSGGKIVLIVLAVLVGGFIGSALITGIIQGVAESINGTPEETDVLRSDPAPEETAGTKDVPASDPVIYTLSEPEQPEQTAAETDAPETEPEQTEPEILTLSDSDEPAEPVTRETPDPLFPEYEHEQTVEYILNTSSKKIHKPTCNDVKKIKPENYSTTTEADYYLSNGYTNCGHCGGAS